MAKQSRTKKQPADAAALKEAIGTDHPHLPVQMINQLIETLWAPEGLDGDANMDRMLSAASLVAGIKPSDTMESMLATQMVATHNAAMDCLRRAMIVGQSFDGREQNLKHASKLLSIYSRQIEVLDKHRGKGQQKVSVEHVHVAAGGQAMVGQFDSGKTEGERKTEAKPEIKAITNSPGEIIDMGLAVKQSEPSRIS